MGQAELLIAGLPVAVGGALFGFVPRLPEVKLDPELVVVVWSIRGCC